MSTVFVTGPTGVLGRATIPQLVASRHAVRALTRSDANDDAIRALGANNRAKILDPEKPPLPLGREWGPRGEGLRSRPSPPHTQSAIQSRPAI